MSVNATVTVTAHLDRFGDAVATGPAPLAHISGDQVTFTSPNGNTTASGYLQDAIDGTQLQFQVLGDLLHVCAPISGRSIGSWWVADLDLYGN